MAVMYPLVHQQLVQIADSLSETQHLLRMDNLDPQSIDNLARALEVVAGSVRKIAAYAREVETW